MFQRLQCTVSFVCNMDSSHHSDMDSSDHSDSSNDSATHASMFSVGDYILDLGQFHGQSLSKGWVHSPEPSSKLLSVAITENFETFSKRNEDEFEQISEQYFVALLKYPGKQQFLVYDVKNWHLFIVKYGRISKVGQGNRLQFIVDKLLKIWEYELKRGTGQEVNGFFLMNREIRVPNHSSNLLIRDFLKRSSYQGGPSANNKEIVELKATWETDDHASPQMQYKSLFCETIGEGCTLKTASTHHMDFKTVRTYEKIIEPAGGSFLCPSEVPIVV